MPTGCLENEDNSAILHDAGRPGQAGPHRYGSVSPFRCTLAFSSLCSVLTVQNTVHRL